MREPIKAYSFSDYINKEWARWKFSALTEAWQNTNKKLKGSSYAYGGNVSKSPILWDEDDWKFLSQFPPEYWVKALMWRYNEGISDASEARDQDPNKSLDAIQNDGTVKLDIGHGKKAVFQNIYTGLKNLFEKLEKPVKRHAAEEFEGVKAGDPGIMDIDPFDQRTHLENGQPNPKHRSNYKYGLHDFDITAPLQMSDEYIDSIPDEEVPLAKGVERTPQNIRAKRELMKEKKLKDFSGMSALNGEEQTAKHIANWVKSQGLGLLGQAPEQKNGLSVQQIELNKINPDWNKERKGRGSNYPKLPMNLPAIKKNIAYKIENEQGQTEDVNKEVSIPVLNSGKLLPRINLSPEQRQKFAERSGFKVEDKCPNTRGLTWAEIEGKCTPAKRAGQVSQLSNLLRNFDLLTPEQKEHLKTNQRDLHHALASKFGATDDVWSKAGEHYAVGWTPNYGKPELTASHLSKEEMKRVLDKYLPQMIQEADKGVGYFIRWAKKNHALPDAKINMLEKIQTDLAKVAGAMLALNLQDPTRGIRDESLKLIGVPEGYDEEANKQNRQNWALGFARTMAQAAFGDTGSRRQLEKSGRITVSGDAPRGSGEGDFSFGQNATAGDRPTGGADWSSRRNELSPQSGGVYDPITGQTTYPVARMGWNIPKMNHDIDKFFDTRRNIIMARAGGEYATLADKARDKMKIVAQTIKEIYEKKAQELMSQGVPQEDIERQAEEAVNTGLKAKLTELRPDLFADVDEENIQGIIDKNKHQMGGEVLTPELQTEKEKLYDQFFDDLLTKRKAHLPELTYDDEEKEYFFDVRRKPNGEIEEVNLDLFAGQSPQNVVQFVRNMGEQYAKKYGVKMVMAVSALNGQPLSQEAATKVVKDAGVEIELPTTAPHQTVMPQKKAATDVSAMISQLPPDYNNIIVNKALLGPEKDKIIQVLQNKYNELSSIRNRSLTPDEYNTHKEIKRIKRTIDQTMAQP